MSDSITTATPETKNAAPTAHPPVRENQVEAEVERSQVAGQRVMRLIGGGSPEVPSEKFAGALGQMSGASQVGMIRQLQRSYGNSYVGKVIQAKLMVGQPEDVYEQEADRVSEQVMRMSDPTTSEGAIGSTQGGGLSIQRMCTECKEKLHRQTIAGKENEATSMPEGIEMAVESARSRSAEPLSDELRTFFEPRFGQDFSHVRLHTDEAATQSADQLGARAYTLGHDIIFGAGQYSPETDGGKRLLAHELTHVVQQGSGRAMPSSAQRSSVHQRTNHEVVQGAWTFTGAVTNPDPVIGESTRGHGSTQPIPLPTGVFGMAKAWQVVAFSTIEGGNAHLVMRRDTRYTFVHTGDDNNLLTIGGSASIFGGAEADDLHYAEAGAAVVGNIAVRTIANPAPPMMSLFPPIQDGGRSEAEESPIGEVDVSLPVGEATVDVHIPLTKTNEGELAPLGESRPINRDIPGGGEWKSVDVYLVAYMEATADIESAFFDLAGDENWAHATARYMLTWEERPIPAAPTPDTGEPEEEKEIEPLFKLRCWSRRDCTGKAYKQKFQHCHNCYNYASGKSLGEPGNCENC